ncbi:MAG TPA: Bro-N domain-containing protein [Trichocoleus sp.]|jgi:phage anti-repressor protein
MEEFISPITAIFKTTAVRFVEINDKYLVSANDVMKQLGYNQPRDAWYRMEPKINQYFGSVCKIPTLTQTGVYEMAYLTEEQLIAVFIKSDKAEAAPFFRWAVTVIKERLDQIKEQQIKAEVAKQLAFTKDEAYYHSLILRYADYSSIKFRSEAIFDNTLPSEDGAKSRRTDLIKILPKCIQVWELKAHAITEDDISRTIAAKGYLSLIAQNYPGKPIDFRFTSPYGITDSGQRLIELLSCQNQYRQIYSDEFTYRCKVSYEPLQVLANRIRQSIITNTPFNHRWQITKFIDPKFNDLLFYPNSHEEHKILPFPIKKHKEVA